MSIELTLPDQLLLLSLNNKSGRFEADSIYLSYHLIGSCLAELLISGHISIVDKKLHCIKEENNEINHPLIKELFLELHEKMQGIKTLYILQNLVLKYGHYQDVMINHLLENGIIKKEKHKILWVFTSTRYPESNSLPESLLRSHLIRVFSEIEPPSVRDVCLIKFLTATGLIKPFKPKEKTLRDFKKELDIILDKAAISDSFKSILKSIDDGVMSAIALLVVVT